MIVRVMAAFLIGCFLGLLILLGVAWVLAVVFAVVKIFESMTHLFANGQHYYDNATKDWKKLWKGLKSIMKNPNNSLTIKSVRCYLQSEDGKVIELTNVADVQLHDTEPLPAIEPRKPQDWMGTQEVKLKLKASEAMSKTAHGIICDLFFNGHKDLRRLYHILTHSKKRRIRKKALKRLRNMLLEGKASN